MLSSSTAEPPPLVFCRHGEGGRKGGRVISNCQLGEYTALGQVVAFHTEYRTLAAPSLCVCVCVCGSLMQSMLVKDGLEILILLPAPP